MSTPPSEAELVDTGVDQSPDVHRATEPDEEQVLTELYGDPDAGRFFRGEAAGEPA